MNSDNKLHAGFSRKIIVLAVLAALNPAYAEEGDDVAQLIKPESMVSAGVGVVSGDSKDRAQFGQYNGLRKDNVYGLLDFSYVSRNDATGTWINLEGRNLGLDSRELSFSHQKQGDWKYFAEYSELVKRNPYTINTGLQGAGTTTPTVVGLTTPGTGANVDLKIKRQSIAVGGEKWITPNLLFEMNFKNEDKDGARVFGKGFACSNNWVAAGSCTAATQFALLLLPEPINSTIRQFETKLSYAGDKLNINGGYYGSFYTNANSTLTPNIPSGLNNPNFGAPLDAGLRNTLALPVALPPDNQAHQFYVAGNYAFTPKVRTTFKFSYTHATQNEDFASNGLTGAPAGVSNLGGVLNTTLAQLGLTARPTSNLSLLANLKYENKKDKTPIAVYNVETTTTATTYFSNNPTSEEKIIGKLEASYRLPADFRATLGADYESINRSLPVSSTEIAGLSALRGKTEEVGFRAELRHSLSETLNGAISYSSSRRSGSDWYSLLSASTGQILTDNAIVAASANAIFPAFLADRERDKVKLSADWSPMEMLSLQFVIEDGKDKNNSAGTKGFRDSGVSLYSLDAALTLSEKWKLTAYASRGEQTLHVNHSTGYVADLTNVNETVGLGVVGKPTSRIEFGANLNFLNDRNRYGQVQDAALSAANRTFLAASGGLPDVTFRQTALKLFGTYALDKTSSMRVDLIHQRTKLDEWTWGYNGVPFTYVDNTTVSQQSHQNVTFLGVSYRLKFQ